MRIFLTLAAIFATLFVAGCFLRFASEGLKVEAGSTYPPAHYVEKTQTETPTP